MKKALLTVATFVLTVVAAHAQTYTDLYNFDGNAAGGNPEGLLAQGRDGNLYGTAAQGTHNSGVVFTMTPSGVLNVVYDFFYFQGQEPDGLTLGMDGNFYGTATEGGTYGLGTIFKGAPGGKGASLYSFTGGADGNTPEAAPIQGADGNFYGATLAGTAYKITSSGSFTPLGSLPGPSYSPLLQATDGNFYGTSYSGGTANEGTVFKMTRAGTATILYDFDTTHGSFPAGSLIQGNNGSLYGTTQGGGAYNNGVLFKLTTERITVLHNFGDPNYPNDGTQPLAGLLLATDGNFYGVTVSGGGTNGTCGSGCGVIFQLTPSGNYSILHDFDGADGSVPRSAPVQHTNGKIYGVTPYGGTMSQGVVYNLDMALAPFVRLVSPIGRFGQTGGILGQGFTGTTSVSFNGTPATFTVVSDTYLTATVPSGATTGFVTVVTPTGTLTSNQQFRVRP